MDLFSHALLPYLLGRIFKRNKYETTALVLGGIAPDFDVLLLWINYVYPTFFLITHRGITHSIFFGFITGLFVLYLGTREIVKNKIRKYVDYNPSISHQTAAFAFLGVLIHLFLDYSTTRGVPLFYPFEVKRYSAEIFFYTDIYLTILSLIMVIYLFKRPIQKNTIAKFLIIYIIAFALLGGVRYYEKQNTVSYFQIEGIRAYPTMDIFDWYAISSTENKIKIFEYSGLKDKSTYNETFPKLWILKEGDGLNEALILAGDLPQVKMFKWRSYAIAINASSENGIWSFEYYDPLQRVMFKSSSALLRRGTANWSSVRVKVEAGKAVIL